MYEDAADLIARVVDVEAVVTSGRPALLEFFAPWCGHCQAFAGEYRVAAATLAAEMPTLSVGAIDCVADAAVCSSNAVKMYPTLRLYDPVGAVSDFSGRHTARHVVEWVTRTALTFPAAQPLVVSTDAAVRELVADSPLVLAVPALEAGEDVGLRRLALRWGSVAQIGGWRPTSAAQPSALAALAPQRRAGERSLWLLHAAGRALALPTDLMHADAARALAAVPEAEAVLSSALGIRFNSTHAARAAAAARDKLAAGGGVGRAARATVAVQNASAPEADLHEAVRAWLTYNVFIGVEILSGARLRSVASILRVLGASQPPVGPAVVGAMATALGQLADAGDDVPRARWESMLDAHGVRASADGQPAAWRECAPSVSPFTCGLWLVLHAATVRAAADADASSVFAAVVDLVDRFFGCDTCRAHFLALVEADGAALRTRTAGRRELALWLWRAHNSVNARLARERSSPRARGKAQRPTRAECPQCKGGEGAWDEQAVLSWLARRYCGPAPGPGAQAPRRCGSIADRTPARANAWGSSASHGLSTNAAIADVVSASTMLPAIPVWLCALALCWVWRRRACSRRGPAWRRGGAAAAHGPTNLQSALDAGSPPPARSL